MTFGVVGEVGAFGWPPHSPGGHGPTTGAGFGENARGPKAGLPIGPTVFTRPVVKPADAGAGPAVFTNPAGAGVAPAKAAPAFACRTACSTRAEAPAVPLTATWSTPFELLPRGQPSNATSALTV